MTERQPGIVVSTTETNGTPLVRLMPRAALPVVEQISTTIPEKERARIRRIASDYRAGEPALSATEAFGPRVSVGLASGPALLFEDHLDVPLASWADVTHLEHRSLLLASDGDVFAIGGHRNPAFEAYCRDVLGLGIVDVHTAAPAPGRSPMPLAERCARDPAIMDRIAAVAAQHGHLNLIPYLGTGSVWKLAAAIAERGRIQVHVAAPPPRLTARVNDKVWFADCVTRVLGNTALPRTFSAYGPAALAVKVRTLARSSPKIGIKIPSSSGSMGNLVVDSRDLIDLSGRALTSRLSDMLRSLGWQRTYPLLVEVWDCPVTASPSAQLWIPPPDEGDPVVEGIFDQALRGVTAEFIGAAPTALSQEWRQRIADEAARIGLLLQELGYYGRCSLDSVLAGDSPDKAQLHWLECNGRWGGVSISLTLANRLVGDWDRRPFVVVHLSVDGGRGRPFGEVLQDLKDDLFRPGQKDTGVVLLTPSGFEDGRGLHFMVFAETVEASQRCAKRMIERLYRS
ncbi:MAG: hypothetical protein OEQ29_24980 [Alphaproteobacteria bacterium]|nr:hypothetical protein [Alphaproteobacteria bacterium]